jgi:hypothetical protein
MENLKRTSGQENLIPMKKFHSSIQKAIDDTSLSEKSAHL